MMENEIWGMDKGTFILFLALVTAISLWIFHMLIASATKSRKILREQKIQTEILKKMAKQNGVDEAVIREIENAN